MAIAFKSGSKMLDATSGLKEQVLDVTESFGRPIRTATVALQAFRLQYKRGDHNVAIARAGIEKVHVDEQDQTVKFKVFITLLDETRDDDYSGTIAYTVIADVA